MSSMTLFTNIVLIDGKNRDDVPDACLLVEDEKIVYAGPEAGLPEIPKDIQCNDCQGAVYDSRPHRLPYPP